MDQFRPLVGDPWSLFLGLPLSAECSGNLFWRPMASHLDLALAVPWRVNEAEQAFSHFRWHLEETGLGWRLSGSSREIQGCQA